MTLHASQNPYFAIAGNRPLYITWDWDDEPVEIWERFSKASPPIFVKRDLTDSERTNRKIEVPINKGEVYAVALYIRDSEHPDPNDNLTDPAPRDLLTVVGVIDQHRDLVLLPDGIGKGGTYIAAPVTTKRSCFCLLQVGTTAPVVIPTTTKSNVELKQIVTPDAEDRSPNGTFHDLECKPLIPGELYSVVIMAVDEEGYWDCKDDVLNTKLRQVDISINNIHVKNDGDPGGAGQAEFWVTVFEGGSAGITAAREFHLGNDDYRVYDGEDIFVAWNVTIGPKKVDPTVNALIAVHTNALEYDGIEGTEKAGSDGTDTPLRFPVGRDEETEEFDVHVGGYPLRDDDFEYSIRFDWKVKYV